MNYKLLMESWRKFLKEEDRFPEKPHDPMSGEKRLYDPEQAKKNKEMLASLDNSNTDSTFPIVNGKNFVEPIPGVVRIDSSFGQPRGSDANKGNHGAIDQNVKGMECVSISDATVINIVPASWYNMIMLGFQKTLRERVYDKQNSQFVGFRDFVDAHSKGGTRSIKSIQALKNKISKISSAEVNMLGKMSWPELKSWCKRNLVYNAAASLLRHYGETGSLSIKGAKIAAPQGGVSVVIETEPDQNGKKYIALYSHMSSISVSRGQKLKRGQEVGVSGDTSIFDSRAHLHFAMSLSDGFGGKLKKLDPLTLIPPLAQGETGLYGDAEDQLPK